MGQKYVLQLLFSFIPDGVAVSTSNVNFPPSPILALSLFNLSDNPFPAGNIYLACFTREYLRVKYHYTIDLLFDWFGLVCFANKNKNCQ